MPVVLATLMVWQPMTPREAALAAYRVLEAENDVYLNQLWAAEAYGKDLACRVKTALADPKVWKPGNRLTTDHDSSHKLWGLAGRTLQLSEEFEQKGETQFARGEFSGARWEYRFAAQDR